MTDTAKQIGQLTGLLAHSFARFERAVELQGPSPVKVLDLKSPRPNPEDGHDIFEIPMVPFKWIKSFEGMETMLIDDNKDRTVCGCKTTGSVRLPLYTHRRNERVIITSGSIKDHILGREYFSGEMIDYPMETLRDWEFIDCSAIILLTPPLDYQQNQSNG